MKQPFGFTSGPDTIELPGLHTQVCLRKGISFRYDGEVPSLSRNISRTVLELRGIIQEERDLIGIILGPLWNYILISIGAFCFHEKFPDLETTRAYCYHHSFNHTDAYVIAKEKGLSSPMSLFADGHESGHLLEHLEMRSVLQQLIEDAKIPLELSSYTGEDFADVAGFLALFRSSVHAQLPQFRQRVQERQAIASVFPWSS